MSYCSRCFERHAIIFVSRHENGADIDEGFCLKCAYESGISSLEKQLVASGINAGNVDEMSDKIEISILENGTEPSMSGFFQSLEKTEYKPFVSNRESNTETKNKMIDLEAVRKFFEGDKYATEATGIVIEKVEKGHSVVSLEPDGRHLNAVGGLMGAVYYTMADFAFAVAENCILDSDTVTVTQATQMNFLRAWHGGKVTCKADIVKDGRFICLYEVKAFDTEGKELALIIVNGFKTARK